MRRKGLDRIKQVLKETSASVLLGFKVSRIFRKAYRGLAFFTEEVVEQNKRAISVSQGIDTAQKDWKLMATMHGLSDEMLLDTIADHVHSGLKNFFREGYVTGPLTVGYEPEGVPNAPLTNNGKPRTMPRVTAWVAEMITQHYTWIAERMSIKEGWRRWKRDGGPKDPRSTSPFMTYSSYRRMLSNPRYTGRWAFGRKRSRWNNGKDYNMQVLMPDTEVTPFECDELRIVSDELFNKVQLVLAENTGREPGPRRDTRTAATRIALRRSSTS